MFNPFILMATLVFTSPGFAKEREVATIESQEVVLIETRSFFEPKTEADLNALATLEMDLVKSLDQEPLQ